MKCRALMLITMLSVALAAPTRITATSSDTLVTVGSPTSPFTQNKQNEPAIAVDANHPNILAAGSNDEIDLEACNAGNPTTCPFTPGVGVSGIYFSFNSGTSWTQPTYSGWTARDCVGAPGFTCTPHVGPIGTLPKYYENGLVSGGDPALAFGPRPGADGTFSWANGERLYYANLTANFRIRSGSTTRHPVLSLDMPTSAMLLSAARRKGGRFPLRSRWIPLQMAAIPGR